MKITSAHYEHTALGFPKIVLKWHFQEGAHQEPYLVICGVICPYTWSVNQPKVYTMDAELARFDDWVRRRYGDDPTVQG